YRPCKTRESFLVLHSPIVVIVIYLDMLYAPKLTQALRLDELVLIGECIHVDDLPRDVFIAHDNHLPDPTHGLPKRHMNLTSDDGCVLGRDLYCAIIHFNSPYSGVISIYNSTPQRVVVSVTS